MFSIIVFLVLFNMIIFYKEITKLYNSLKNYEITEDIDILSTKFDNLLTEISDKLNKTQNHLLNKYNNFFDSDDENNEYIKDDYDIFKDFLKQLNHYKKFKYIINKLKKDNNDINLIKNIILFSINNNIKLYLFGYKNINKDTEIENDIDKLIIENLEKINYLSNYNFYSTYFGYIKKLSNNEIITVPCKNEVTDHDLINELITELKINRDEITFLNEDIFDNL